MQLPHIHLNGTPAETLERQYYNAVYAVSEALEDLRKIETHGRDYYAISSDAINVAVSEHRERVAKLESVKADLERLVLHCRKDMKD